MAKEAKTPSMFPFMVRMVGWNQDQNGMKGHESEIDAIADRDDRNARAEKLGIKARYEVVILSSV